MNKCSHAFGEGVYFGCTCPTVHIPRVWQNLCDRCPHNDGGTRMVDPVFKEEIGVCYGPGDFLHVLLTELDIHPSGDCNCASLQVEMNQWGIGGCRKHIYEICDQIYENYEKWKIGKRGLIFQQAVIAAKLVSMGIIVNPLDPIRSIVLEAIRRAEAQRESQQPP